MRRKVVCPWGGSSATVMVAKAGADSRACTKMGTVPISTPATQAHFNALALMAAAFNMDTPFENPRVNPKISRR